MTRLVFLDIAKAFAIFLVVWGHCLQYLYAYEDGCHSNVLYLLIYTFHMPLFMMMAGYFSLGTMMKSLPEVVRKKFMQLVLPCLVWTLLSIVARKGMATVWTSDMDKLYDIPGQFAQGAYQSFWFLKSLFLCYLFGWIAIRLTNKYGVLVGGAISLALSQCVGMYHLPLMFTPFFAGMLLRRYNFFGQSVALKVKVGVVAAMVFVVLLYWLDRSFWFIPNLGRAVGHWQLMGEIFLKRGWRIAIGLAGSVALLCLFEVVFRENTGRGQVSRWITMLGQETMAIYILQTFVLEQFLSSLICFHSMPLWLFDVITLLLSVLVIIVCIYIIHCLGRYGLCRKYMFGKNS